jgi:hypothetical protein
MDIDGVPKVSCNSRVLKTMQREAAFTRGLIQGGKEGKTGRVRIREQMGLNFRELGTKSSELIAV